MQIELSYRDLRKELLSEKALGLLSEFTLIWHADTGEHIDLDSDDAVLRVFRSARLSSNQRLRAIFLHLRAEFSNTIEKSLSHCDAMLADQLMSHISMGRTCRLVGASGN